MNPLPSLPAASGIPLSTNRLKRAVGGALSGILLILIGSWLSAKERI